MGKDRALHGSRNVICRRIALCSLQFIILEYACVNKIFFSSDKFEKWV